jgi:TolA-binding protein
MSSVSGEMNTMRKWISVPAVAVVITIFTGCTHLTMLRTQEIRAVRDHADSLDTQILQLQKKILEEQETQGEMIRLMRADQQVRLGEIGSKVTSIEGGLTENQQRLSKIDEQTSDFKKRLEAKMAADSTAANSRATEIGKLLQIARSDFDAGRYDIAYNGFKDLYGQFPESPQAQEAEYWAAECLNAKRNYDEAEKAYINYIKKYPQGSKLCSALFKLGSAYEKDGKAKSRDIVWKKLTEQCPDSPEAQMAKSHK